VQQLAATIATEMAATEPTRPQRDDEMLPVSPNEATNAQ
jgi:hypothetical protein